MRFPFLAAVILLFAPIAACRRAPPPPAGGAVPIILGEHPSDLERFAAGELSRYLERLFGIRGEIKSSAKPGQASGFILGTTGSNPAVRRLIPPPPGSQAIVLKRVDRDSGTAFVIAGGSPRAVLWGVYDLLERYGVRYLLHGDVFPDAPGQFRYLDLDVTLRPNRTIRSWRLMNAGPTGTESWGLAENERFIDQLAKMKCNRVYLSFWPWQSFSDYRDRGVAKRTGVSFFGQRFPIDDQTIGRKLFGDARLFDNPEFAAATTYEQRHEAAKRLARGILEHAKERGMDAGIMVQPLEFPIEFRSVLRDAIVHPTSGPVETVAPGPKQTIDDRRLVKLVVTVIRSYLGDYPEADWLCLDLPEHGEWPGMGDRGWKILNRKYHLSSTGVRGDLAGLYFLDWVIRDDGLLARRGKPDLHLVYSNASEAPPGSELMRNAAQPATDSRIGDLDPAAYFLEKSAWDDSVTPDSAYADLFGSIAGPEASGMLTRAMKEMEDAARILDRKDPSFFLPAAGMLTRHYEAAEPIPAEWLQIRTDYEQALINVRRARLFSRPAGDEWIDHEVGRLECAVAYLDAVKFIRLAGVAAKQGRREEAAQWMKRTVDAVVQATNAIVRVARGNSDRGVVCVLNEFACKPAKDLLAKLSGPRSRSARFRPGARADRAGSRNPTPAAPGGPPPAAPG